MCGRYTLDADADELVEAFDVPPPTFGPTPRYNVAPGQDAPIVARDRHGRRVGLMRWGFVPARRARPGSPIVNARAETVATRPSFREAFRRRRCVVPADGFYEWRAGSDGTTPYWLHPRRGRLLPFAGIWEQWTGEGGEPCHGFAIITVDGGPDVVPIHDRMPAILAAPDAVEAWLATDTGPDRLLALLRSAPEGTLSVRRVSTRVNRPAEDDVGLIDEVADG